MPGADANKVARRRPLQRQGSTTTCWRSRTGRAAEEVALESKPSSFIPSLRKHFAYRRYRKAKDWVWAQEESQNMGAWTFMEPRLRALGQELAYVGRDASSSPATGSLRIHRREQDELVTAALTGAVPHIVQATTMQSAVRPPAADKTPAVEKSKVS